MERNLQMVIFGLSGGYIGYNFAHDYYLFGAKPLYYTLGCVTGTLFGLLLNDINPLAPYIAIPYFAGYQILKRISQ